MMILIGLIALGLDVYDYLHRIEVIVANRSGEPIAVARIMHEGRTVALGPIHPGWQTSKRIRSPMSGLIAVDVETRGAARPHVRRLEISLGGRSMRWTTETRVQFDLRDDGAHFGILQR